MSSTRKRWIGSVVALSALAVVAYASTTGAQTRESSSATKGTIPEAAWTERGPDPEMVPDYISVLGNDGEVAGYIEKKLALSPPDDESTIIPVYGEDLRTIVGNFYPNRGFVPLGTDYRDVPTTPITTSVGQVSEE